MDSVFKTLIVICIVLDYILIHIAWKRIENLEKWTKHLIERTAKINDEMS